LPFTLRLIVSALSGGFKSKLTFFRSPDKFTHSIPASVLFPSLEMLVTVLPSGKPESEIEANPSLSIVIVEPFSDTRSSITVGSSAATGATNPNPEISTTISRIRSGRTKGEFEF
jgi:hypothetical protein